MRGVIAKIVSLLSTMLYYKQAFEKTKDKMAKWVFKYLIEFDDSVKSQKSSFYSVFKFQVLCFK